MATQRFPINYTDKKLPGEPYYLQGVLNVRGGISPMVRSNDLNTLANVVSFIDGNYFMLQNGTLYKYDPTLNTLTLQSTYTGGTYGLLVAPNDKVYVSTATTLYEWNGTTNTTLGTYPTAYGPFFMTWYEGNVITTISNKLSIYSVQDASFNSNKTFDMPANSTPLGMVANRKGILMMYEVGNQYAIVLWDLFKSNATRSITPWIWIKDKPLSMTTYDGNWIIVTKKRILLTNGYDLQVIDNINLDDPLSKLECSVPKQGIYVLNEKLYISLSYIQSTVPLTSTTLRNRSGILIYDLATRSRETLVPISANIDLTPDTISENYITYNDGTGTMKLAQLTYNFGYPQIYTGWYGDNIVEKDADNVQILTHQQEVNSTPRKTSITFDVKIANNYRQLWQYTSTSSSGANTTSIRVDGSSATRALVEVGDEVTLLTGGASAAGLVRHIVNISNAGTVNETWVVDEAYPSILSAGIKLMVQPFKRIEKRVISNQDELKHLKFPIRNGMRGRAMMVKILLDGDLSGNTCFPVISQIELMYKDSPDVRKGQHDR